MSSEKTEALVIRHVDFSETSKVVTLFTRDFGKISAIAKGARRPKSPFEAAIDLLTVCRIVFLRKSSASLDILTEAQLVSRFRPSGRELERLYGGYYIAELLRDLTVEYDPHPNLFVEAVDTLRNLSENPHPSQRIVRFELIVLREIGQLPAFDVCISCDSPIVPSESYGFWVSQGGLICRNCRKEEYQQNLIQPGTIRLLQEISARTNDHDDRLIISPEQVKEIRSVVTPAISHALGHRPKMFRYLHQ